jgi:hypothetical protein
VLTAQHRLRSSRTQNECLNLPFAPTALND